jgi:hypothetical protein
MSKEKDKKVGKIQAFKMGVGDSTRKHLYEAGQQVVDGIVEALRDIPDGWQPPGADRWQKKTGVKTGPGQEPEVYVPKITVLPKKPGLLRRLGRAGIAILGISAGSKKEINYPWLKDKND